MFRHQRVTHCLTAAFIVLAASCAGADPKGPQGQVIERGLIDCLEYAIRIIAVDYTIGDSGLALGDEFKVIYDFDSSHLGELNLPIALSSIEYDRHHDRIYLLTSFEQAEGDDEGIGAYLWLLSMEALEQGGAPQLIRKTDGKPLLLAHKGEGVAVLNENSVFVIHDDDRVLGRSEITNPETQFSRERHQAAFSVIGLQ